MYATLFLFLLVICTGFQYRSWKQQSGSHDHTLEFKKFQKNYLVVFVLVSAADWLQGSHVYALYEHYGFSRKDIGALFVAGFGSSFLFGTIVGGLADKYGRKSFSKLYCILYILSCLTKHSSSFWMLMIGRLFGGVATSLLFSVFESWMVHAHRERGFESSLLGTTFGLATTANSIVAISSGIVANLMADVFGFVAPFDVSILLLVAAYVIIDSTWTENYGDASALASQSFKGAFEALRSDPRIFALGAMQSLFEAAMYSFVFSWTPALSSYESRIPYGYVFAVFMQCVMIGSLMFSYLTDEAKLGVENFVRWVFLLASLCMYIPVVSHSLAWIRFSFFAFEACVGVFWPSIGTLRSKYIPEDVRATVMNLFRVPLNLLVLFILFNSGNLRIEQIFLINSGLLALAAGFSHFLFTRAPTDSQSLLSHGLGH
eukprot:ANDGO_08609.mRNA.1 hypothetical protein DDB_G0283633